MALTAILDMATDVRPFFGNPGAADDALLQKLLKWTEAQARKFVGHGIIQATYTNEYQRKFDYSGCDSDTVSITSNGLIQVGGCISPAGGAVLQLDNGFVRSITEIREDYAARFAASGYFGSDTLLVDGTDYYLEMDNDNFSKSGRVIRYGRNWSPAAGTIRITYVAGLSAAELDDEYSFVKLALLDDLRSKFNAVASERISSGKGGPLKKETYYGDVSFEYETGSASRSSSLVRDLSDSTKSRLQPIRRMLL